MAKSRQALCSVTAVALLPEASSHKQEHIILSKEDLFNILRLLDHLTNNVADLTSYNNPLKTDMLRCRERLQYLSEVCEPPKDQPSE
jgi:hypothetical protein